MTSPSRDPLRSGGKGMSARELSPSDGVSLPAASRRAVPLAASVESPAPRSIPTTCIETIGGDPATAIRLSFQIKVF